MEFCPGGRQSTRNALRLSSQPQYLTRPDSFAPTEALASVFPREPADSYTLAGLRRSKGMNMSDIAWATEHSVETTATPAFTWTYMTDVKHWDDPPAEFALNGSFTSGSLGTTRIPGQMARQWRLREVKPHDSYTIEIALEGAVILCKWVFNELPNSQTRLTQHITLKGENASSYEGDVRRTFDLALAPGMSRIAIAIDRAYARDPGR
jgi:hypothetical protein